MRLAVIRIAAVVLASLVGAHPAAAHEKGVLRPATREPAAGDSLTVMGERFSRSATLDVLLVGPRGRIALGEVRTDSTGRLAARLVVPAETAPGSYRLVAVAPDGDEVATVDVTVQPATAPDTSPATPPPVEEPSAAPLVLERARAGWLTGGVAAGAVLAAIAGIALFRRRA